MQSFVKVSSHGTIQWCRKKGNWHRGSDLPAVIYPNGDQYWYKDGKRHRDNGLPAVLFTNGYKEYWVDGVELRYEEDI